MNYVDYNFLKIKHFKNQISIEIMSEKIHNFIELSIKDEYEHPNNPYNSEIIYLKKLKSLIYDLTLKKLLLGRDNKIEYLNPDNIYNNFNYDIYFSYKRKLYFEFFDANESKILELKKIFIEYFENLHYTILLKKLISVI